MTIFHSGKTSPLYTVEKLDRNPGVIFEHVNNAISYTEIINIFTTFDTHQYQQLRKNLSHQYRKTLLNMTHMGIDFLPYLHDILTLTAQPPTDSKLKFLQDPTTEIIRIKNDYNVLITNQIQDTINNFRDYKNVLTDAPKLYHDIARRLYDIMHAADKGKIHSSLFSAEELNRFYQVTKQDKVTPLTNKKGNSLGGPMLDNCNVITIKKIAYGGTTTLKIQLPYHQNEYWIIYKTHAPTSYSKSDRIFSYQIRITSEYIAVNSQNNETIFIDPTRNN